MVSPGRADTDIHADSRAPSGSRRSSSGLAVENSRVDAPA